MEYPTQAGAALLTDLYELTMAAAYFVQGKHRDLATFELSIRRLPENRNFLLAAGLEQAVEHLLDLRFSHEDLAFLRRHPMFQSVPADFFEYLTMVRFSGEVWAAAEGSIVFAEEPLLRITAPVVECQLAETFLLSMLTFQTMVATKAARVVQEARGRSVVEFGSRRAHGPQAGLLAARAAYLGGCDATSNTLAGKVFGIPTAGTFAHSWTMAFDEEVDAFRAFVDLYGEQSTLLLDTYDALGGARRAARFSEQFRGVRLDSGDIVALSKQVRQILDENGHAGSTIMASGDLNEYRIRDYLAAGAPLDSFGVGTELVTSHDAPSLSGIFKLVEIERGGQLFYTAKFSDEKATWPGKKQVFRFCDNDGQFAYDLLGRAEEEGEPAAKLGEERLLHKIMSGGRLIDPLPSLEDSRRYAARNLAKLPEMYRRLDHPTPFPMRRTEALEKLMKDVREQCSTASSST
jgi:nicotinate phosphoribosyltransferase